MKKLKILPTAFLFAITAPMGHSTLVKNFIPGNVWCFQYKPNPEVSCAFQPSGRNTDVITVVVGGSTVSPCDSAEMTYITTASSCTTPTLGTEYRPTME